MNTWLPAVIVFAILALSLESAASPPTISLGTPREGRETGASRIRVAGMATPGARVTVNGVEMYSHSAGGFAGLLDLTPGENIVRAVAELGGETAEVSVKVLCTRPTPADPAGTEILNGSVEPGEEVELLPGDDVVVSLRGTPGRKAVFSIGDLCKDSPMAETVGSDGWAVYKGVYRIQPGDKASGSGMEVSLSDGTKTVTEQAGTLAVRDPRNPVVGYVSGSRGIVRSAPGGTWDMIWPSGIKAEVTGRMGRSLRLSMPGGKQGWIYEGAMEILPAGTPPPRALVGTIISKTTDYGVSISLSLAEKLPFEVIETVHPPAIELLIYGGYAETSWINRDLDGIVGELQWSQPEDGIYRLRVALDQKQIWGWDAHYEEGALILEIKRAPKLAAPPASPLHGLTIYLDAGHGGRESGAVGPTGFEEKVANLDITKKLARKLRMKGARVVLTRTKDDTVPLEDRPEKAVAAHADIMVAIHNNSVAESSDPVKVKGVSTYWYHPQAMALSEHMYRRSLEVGVPGLGDIYSNLAIIRPHRMIAVLIEGAFMSNPDEEALLRTPEFRQKLADSLLLGLEDWVNAVRSETP